METKKAKLKKIVVLFGFIIIIIIIILSCNLICTAFVISLIKMCCV